MTEKGQKANPKVAAAGAANLAKYHEQNPSGSQLTHGVYSRHMRAKYSDCRFKEGKILRKVMKSLRDDLGGDDVLSAGQALILDTSIRPKLITLLAISFWLESDQRELVNENGELAKCLSTNYLAFSNSLRLDLLALYQMNTGKRSRIPTIEDLIRVGGKE